LWLKFYLGVKRKAVARQPRELSRGETSKSGGGGNKDRGRFKCDEDLHRRTTGTNVSLRIKQKKGDRRKAAAVLVEKGKGSARREFTIKPIKKEAGDRSEKKEKRTG